jgi:hypothetical protein
MLPSFVPICPDETLQDEAVGFQSPHQFVDEPRVEDVEFQGLRLVRLAPERTLMSFEPWQEAQDSVDLFG